MGIVLGTNLQRVIDGYVSICNTSVAGIALPVLGEGEEGGEERLITSKQVESCLIGF